MTTAGAEPTTVPVAGSATQVPSAAREMKRGAIMLGPGPATETSKVDASYASSKPGDVLIGCAVALVACSNLVQGMWVVQLPWLNVTFIGLAIVVPAILLAINRRLPLIAIVAVLLLLISLILGFVEPATNASAADKRISLMFAVLFVLAASMLTLSNRRRLHSFLGTIVVLAIVVMLGQLLIPDPLDLIAGRRTPTGQNSIGTGRMLGAGLVVIAAAAFKPLGKGRRIILALIACPLAVGIVSAGSRGPIVGLLVSILLLIWIQPGKRRTARFATMLGVVAASWVGYYLLLAGGSRVASGSGSGRWQLYSDAVEVAYNHPLGVGWGNFHRFAPSSAVASYQGDDLYAHNIFLEFWLETGILGVALFTVFLVVTIRAGLANLQESLINITILALGANLFTGALFSSDIVGNRLMWVIFGVLLAYGTGASRKTRDGIHRSRPRGSRRHGSSRMHRHSSSLNS